MELIVRDQTKEQRFIETAEKIAARPIESLKPIKDNGEYQYIADTVRVLKAFEAEVVEYYADAKKRAHEEHKKICDEEASYTKPVKKYADALKKLMGDYLAEKEAERRRQEEALRAAARAEAERLMAEAAKLEAQGQDASAMVDEAIATESVGNMMTVEANATKADGISMRKDWKITSISYAEVPTEMAGVMIRPVDEAAVMRLIRATKGTIKIPGIEYTVDNKVVARR